MPIIKSSSDLQRNFGAISELAHETGEPIYITRNGESSLVVLDVEVYERTLELEQEIHDYEMEILDKYLASEEEIRAGHTTSYESYRLRRAELTAEVAMTA